MIFVPPEMKKEETVLLLGDHWKEQFQEFYSTNYETIDEKMKKFNDHGAGNEIVKVVKLCIQKSSWILDTHLSDELADKIQWWFDGITLIIDGAAKSWNSFVQGKFGAGLDQLENAIASATAGVVPAVLQTNESYKDVAHYLDATMGNLTDYIMQLKKRTVQSTICNRVRVERGETDLTCPGDFHLSHGKCKKGGALLEQTISNDATLAGKGDSDTGHSNTGVLPGPINIKVPEPEPDPECKESSTKVNNKCLCKCPEGSEAMVDDCLQDCPRDFKHEVDGTNRCARHLNPSEWGELNLEKVKDASVPKVLMTRTGEAVSRYQTKFSIPECPMTMRSPLTC